MATMQPQLVIGGKIFSDGEDWTSNGPQAGIACEFFSLKSQYARTNCTNNVIAVTCRLVRVQ